MTLPAPPPLPFDAAPFRVVVTGFPPDITRGELFDALRTHHGGGGLADALFVDDAAVAVADYATAAAADAATTHALWHGERQCRLQAVGRSLQAAKRTADGDGGAGRRAEAWFVLRGLKRDSTLTDACATVQAVVRVLGVRQHSGPAGDGIHVKLYADEATAAALPAPLGLSPAADA